MFIKRLLEKFVGDESEKQMKEITPLVDEINKEEEKLQKNVFDDKSEEMAFFQEKTKEFQSRLKNGETVDDILIEAFAVVKNACRRLLGSKFKILDDTELVWNMVPYDVQIIGAIILHRGKIAEMKTGEGKTLVATMPIYLNALEGKGAFLVTVNDYLAKRDSAWMGFLYNYLGLSIGCLVHGMSTKQKKIAYNSDITYGTNNEFGFDYLRDNMAKKKERQVQRNLNFVIVDEVDSILIDEARTPLIISTSAEESTNKYIKYSQIINNLDKNSDYEIDEKRKVVTLTDDGINKIENILGIENIYQENGFEEIHHIEQALKAKAVFKKNIDYIVKNESVIIVDDFTGRLMPGRRYSGGLHQAIEAKERVEIKRESKTLASITFQNYFRLFKKLSGMTATAKTEEEEFIKIYELEVIIVPTNKSVQRNDKDDSIYKNENGKFLAIAKLVEEKHSIKQPILVGTISIEKSEKISSMLKRRGIKHNVLNAKHHKQEAEIIANAGQNSSVTIATNMAGRGTDIKLEKDLNKKIIKSIIEKIEKYSKNNKKIEFISSGNFANERFEILNDELKKTDIYKNLEINEKKNQIRNFEQWDEDVETNEISFGLAVLGTERHESRRIDNQLRGRSGRQGDFGVSQFFVSADDDLMRIFGTDRMKKVMTFLNVPDDMPIENKMISKSLENAQKQVEGYNFDTRKHIVEYDDVMNYHREIIYKKRQKILESENLHSEIVDNFKEEISESVNDIIFNKSKQTRSFDEKIEKLLKHLEKMYPNGKNNFEEIFDKIETKEDFEDEKIKEKIEKYFLDLLKSKQEMQEDEKMFYDTELYYYLETIDELWMRHLDEMSRIRERVSLSGYGQKDPLVEYKNESFFELKNLLVNIRLKTIFKICNLKIKENTETENRETKTNEDKIIENMTENIGAKEEVEKLSKDIKKVGRNDKCPCGSGKKFKKCCGKT